MADALAVSWSRTSGRDHQDASSFTVGLVSPLWPDPVDALAVNGALVTVTTGSVMVARGWITEARYHVVSVRTNNSPTTEQRRRWVLTCDDVASYAAGLDAGEFSWPLLPESERVATINSQTLDPIMVARSGPDLFGPRDVSGGSLLDLARVSCLPWLTMTESAGGLTARPLVGMLVYWTSYGSPAYTSPINGLPIPTPAGRLSDVPRARTRRDRLTSCTATQYTRTTPTGDPVRVTGTVNAPAAPTNAATWSRESDYLSTYSDGRINPELSAWFASILKAAQWPTLRLDGTVTLYPGAECSDAVDALLDIDRRALVTLELTGAPADVYPLQRVVGGRLTISPTGAGTAELEAVDLELEPATLSGVRPCTWRDVPGAGTPWPQTFALMGTVRLSALRYVANL